MIIRASGRSALLIAANLFATGLLIYASAPLYAQTADAPEQAAAVGSATDTSVKPAKPARHHSAKKTASKSSKADRLAARNAEKAAAKAAEEDAAKAAETAKPDAANASMSPGVANANAQWPSDTTTNATTATMGAQAGNAMAQMGNQQEQPATAAPETPATDAQVVSSDQLNELDRAATDQAAADHAAVDSKPPLTLARATIDTPTDTAVSSNSPWDQTSLIGKIFIAFGGLLTMASAARMFMA